jgi:hypothetical protein
MRIAPFLVCDSASGAPLGGCIHAIRGRGNRAGVSMRDVQTDLPSRHAGCDRRPFLAAFPQLACPRRTYVEAEERAHFEVGRVDMYLSEWKWRRTVDVRGQISLAD